jgi:hypothetical protein
VDQSFQVVASQGSDVISASVAITGDQKIFSDSIVVPITPGTVDYLIPIDVDTVKSYIIVSDQNMTLTTAAATGVADVILMKAGEPIFWNHKMLLVNHFANKNAWQKWTFSAAPAAGTVKVMLIVDSTP